MKKLSLICVALLLSACGGSGGDNGSGGGMTPEPTPTVPTPTVDMFYATVAGLVNLMPDDTEPGDISALDPAAIEDKEPTDL